MSTLPPESHALVLAQRNFDALPEAERVHWSSRFQKVRRAPELPWPERVIIELANTCNLDCPMCRVGANGVNLARVMPLGSFKDLASQLLPHVREVRLNGLGESTLIPDFGAYLDVLREHPVQVELITNGTGAVPLYTRMVDEGATLLFSWDAAQPALFERLRRPARWDVLVGTLRAVAEHARRQHREQQLFLLFTLQGANRAELPALVDRAAEWGIPHLLVNVVKQRSDAWIQPCMEELLAVFGEAENRAQRSGIRLFLPDTLAGHHVSLASASRTAGSGCDRPWKEVVIRWDLDVQVCNMFNPYTYGNLSLRPFEHVWRGAFAQLFRENLNTPRCHPYCRGCYFLKDVHVRKG
ncbi:SPASM domain-containing protein [Archangium violaceum]|uniref:SPASM domain-containing protein n=1 Tax=Archangium violaceum TaxID=83451 RepID=UPI00193AFE39|nr:SPASM domain-containing protein [Archangium violaceum]QRK06584.1 SPASM domain-containing protein [Archangium violaceum]